MVDNAACHCGVQLSTGTPIHSQHEDSQIIEPPLTSPDTAARMVPSPLPRSRVVLLAAFSSPYPTVKAASVTSVKTIGELKTYESSPTQRLNRVFLQQDEHCQQSLDLRKLLGTIFSYSNRNLKFSNRTLETEAGFCYFMPNSRLAYEWVYFFDVMPDCYLQLAPTEIGNAYDTERFLVPYSMKGWFDDEKKREEAKEIDSMAQELITTLSPISVEALQDSSVTEAPAFRPQASSRKRKLEIPSQQARGISDAEIDPQLLPTKAKRPRRSEANQEDLSLQPYAAFDHRSLPQVQYCSSMHAQPAVTFGKSGATTSHAMLPPVPVQMLHAHQQVPAAPQLHVMHLSPISSLVPIPSLAKFTPESTARPVLQTVQAPPPASTQPNRNPTNPPSIPNNRQARNRPAQSRAPGGITHMGRGNVMKAWSPERLRAFTDIQGYSLEEVPLTAVSQYGDELSRNQTPASIDPRCCPFDTTMEENLTYMTLATTANRELCSRAKKNWTASEMVYYVYHAHDLREHSTYGRTRLQKQFQKCAKGFEEARPHHVPTASMSNICMDSGLTGDDKYMHDFYLHAMGANVVNHPTGRAAQMLTRVIRHVLRTGDQNTRLSQAAQYAQIHGIMVPAHERMRNNLFVADQPDRIMMASAKSAWEAKFPGKAPS